MELNADLLEWTKKDKRQLIHIVYQASDLERTINGGFLWIEDFICVLTQSLGANVLWVWFVVDFDINVFIDFNFVGSLECCGSRILLALLILKGLGAIVVMLFLR
ncbi:hypothetical protein OIU77_017281 [Salix suchowensis]|uniref:Uncharacterized protein n=1 Tax=Salix suchowensis TaxID=1278906 RepID=A0ABQ8ZNT7_9ROSI|nr:hypothetical protein OIU77_017281 [Salix suchowensis]